MPRKKEKIENVIDGVQVSIDPTAFRTELTNKKFQEKYGDDISKDNLNLLQFRSGNNYLSYPTEQQAGAEIGPYYGGSVIDKAISQKNYDGVSLIFYGIGFSSKVFLESDKGGNTGPRYTNDLVTYGTTAEYIAEEVVYFKNKKKAIKFLNILSTTMKDEIVIHYFFKLDLNNNSRNFVVEEYPISKEKKEVESTNTKSEKTKKEVESTNTKSEKTKKEELKSTKIDEKTGRPYLLGSKFTDKSGYQGPSANSDNINGILGEGGDYKLKFKAWQNQLVNEIVKLINSGEFQDVSNEFGPKPLKKMPKSAAKLYVDGYPNYYSIIKSYNKGHSPEYGAKLLLNAWTKSKRSYTNYSKTTGKAMYLDYAKGGKVADVISEDVWNRLRSNGTDPLYNQYRDENGNFDSEKKFSVEVAERVHKEYQKFVNKYSGYMYEAPDGSTLKSDKTILDVIKENGDDDTTYYNIGWGNAIYQGYMGNADSGPTIYFLSKEDADKFVDVLKRTQSQMKEPLDNVYMYPLEKIVTNVDNLDPESFDDFSDDRTEYPLDPELIQNDEKYDEEYEEDEEDDIIMYAEYLTYDGDFIKREDLYGENGKGVLLDDQDTINEIEGYDTGEVEYDTGKGVYYIEFSKSEPEDEEEDELLEYDELDEEGKKEYLREKEKGYVRKKGDIKLGRYFYPKYQFDGQEVRTVTHIEDAVGGRMVYFIDHLQGDGELGSYMEGFGIDTSYGPIMHESERKNKGSIEDPHYEYAKGGMVNKIIGIARTQADSTDTETYIYPISADVPSKFYNEVGFKLENKNDTVRVVELYIDTKEIVLQGYDNEGENYEDIKVYKIDSLSEGFQKWIAKNLIMKTRREKGKTKSYFNSYAKGGMSEGYSKFKVLYIPYSGKTQEKMFDFYSEAYKYYDELVDDERGGGTTTIILQGYTDEYNEFEDIFYFDPMEMKEQDDDFAKGGPIKRGSGARMSIDFIKETRKVGDFVRVETDTKSLWRGKELKGEIVSLKPFKIRTGPTSTSVIPDKLIKSVKSYAKGGEVKKKGQLSVSDTKKYWGYSDKEWEDLSDYEKNKAKTQAKVDKDNKYAEKMDNSSTKKGDNSMLIGGLAGVLLGIFIKK